MDLKIPLPRAQSACWQRSCGVQRQCTCCTFRRPSGGGPLALKPRWGEAGRRVRNHVVSYDTGTWRRVADVVPPGLGKPDDGINALAFTPRWVAPCRRWRQWDDRSARMDRPFRPSVRLCTCIRRGGSCGARPLTRRAHPWRSGSPAKQPTRFATERMWSPASTSRRDTTLARRLRVRPTPMCPLIVQLIYTPTGID